MRSKEIDDIMSHWLSWYRNWTLRIQTCHVSSVPSLPVSPTVPLTLVIKPLGFVSQKILENKQNYKHVDFDAWRPSLVTWKNGVSQIFDIISPLFPCFLKVLMASASLKIIFNKLSVWFILWEERQTQAQDWTKCTIVGSKRSAQARESPSLLSSPPGVRNQKYHKSSERCDSTWGERDVLDYISQLS